MSVKITMATVKIFVVTYQGHFTAFAQTSRKYLCQMVLDAKFHRHAEITMEGANRCVMNDPLESIVPVTWGSSSNQMDSTAQTSMSVSDQPTDIDHTAITVTNSASISQETTTVTVMMDSS